MIANRSTFQSPSQYRNSSKLVFIMYVGYEAAFGVFFVHELGSTRRR